MIRPATRSDLARWVRGPAPTTRALVLEVDGRPVAIAGLSVMRDHLQAFSAVDWDAKPSRVELGRLAVTFGRTILAEASTRVVARQNLDEDTAPCLLAHLGFEPAGQGVWVHG